MDRMMDRVSTFVLTGDTARLADGTFLVYGMNEGIADLGVNDLRRLLFAWHEKSFYGTELETALHEGRQGLLLSPLMALHYFAAPAPMLHVQVEWTEHAKMLKAAAVLYWEALKKGWFAPSYDAWRTGFVGWKLLLPEEAAARNAEQKLQAIAQGVIYLDEWFSQAVNELLQQDTAFQEAWRRICDEAPLLREHEGSAAESAAAPEWLDEEAWLEAIGWKRDETPFRACLQLIEPAVELGEENWRLQLLLQDKNDPRILVACHVDGEAVEAAAGSVPAAWRSFMSERLSRDVSRWLNILPELSGEGGGLLGELSDDQAWRFLQEGSMKLLQAGYSVFLPSWWEELRKLQPKLKAKLKSSVGSGRQAFFGADAIMSFDWKIAIGGLDLSEEEFRRMAEEKKRLIYLRGRWIQLDPAFIAQVQQAMKRVEKQNGLSFREVLELHLLGQADDHADQPQDTDAEGPGVDQALRIEVELNRHLTELIGQLQQTERIPMQEPPAGLEAGLRRYQLDGVSWLLFMRRFGLGCCLADDMGLGKTIQFIAYLLHVKQNRQASAAPLLLICPTSVLGNWQKELERFAPSLRVHLHYGPQRAKGEAFAESIADCDLVMTSYNLAQLDEEELATVTWDCIGLDEAQNIKNAYTKQSAAIRRLNAGHRIALTGTPIENRLTELWSIFDFMNPGYFGSLNEFSHKYVNPIEKTGDERLIGQVQKLIRPFLLRRVKKDPAIQLDLPEKYEAKAYVSLTVQQAALYENVVKDLMDRIDSLTGIERKGLVLAALTKLKQICNDPALFLKQSASAAMAGAWEERSSKVTRLLEMVDELREEGDNCLIFTQFVEMGHILEGILRKERGEAVQFLHGGVPKKQRDAMIERFQGGAGLPAEDKCGIFILSLKAGGTGLNLTAANHVFHFDRWWNPAVENQATDRAFRIGQTRDVQVHKFVTLGTLEERIDEMIERKQGLSQQIVGSGENWVTEMSTNELKELFTLRREWIGK